MANKKQIEQIIANGLFSKVADSPHPYFTWSGCDYCGKAGEVEDQEGYLNLEESHADPEGNLYEFKICGDCLNRLYYQDESCHFCGKAEKLKGSDHCEFCFVKFGK